MSRPVLGYLTVALLIVYGMVLPNVVTNSASAHDLGWDRVRDGHLKYVNWMSDSEPGGDFRELIEFAEDEWDPHVGISISEVFRESDADVVISSYCLPKSDSLGETHSSGKIGFNRCIMMHKCPDKKKRCKVVNHLGRATSNKLYSTTASRRSRTFVHEFGHALGLSHPRDLTHLESVMSPYHHFTARPGHPPIRLSNSMSTVFDVRPHDIEDVEDLWP